MLQADGLGMHRSEGQAGVLRQQDAEGYYDLIEWAASQPWCTGRVAPHWRLVPRDVAKDMRLKRGHNRRSSMAEDFWSRGKPIQWTNWRMDFHSSGPPGSTAQSQPLSTVRKQPSFRRSAWRLSANRSVSTTIAVAFTVLSSNARRSITVRMSCERGFVLVNAAHSTLG